MIITYDDYDFGLGTAKREILRPLSPSDTNLVQTLCYVASLNGREYLYKYSSYMREVIPDFHQKENKDYENPENFTDLILNMEEFDLPDCNAEELKDIISCHLQKNIFRMSTDRYDFDAVLTNLVKRWIVYTYRSLNWNKKKIGIPKICSAMILMLVYVAKESACDMREKLLLEFKSVLTAAAQDESINPEDSVFGSALKLIPRIIRGVSNGTIMWEIEDTAFLDALYFDDQAAIVIDDFIYYKISDPKLQENIAYAMFSCIDANLVMDDSETSIHIRTVLETWKHAIGRLAIVAFDDPNWREYSWGIFDCFTRDGLTLCANFYQIIEAILVAFEKDMSTRQEIIHAIWDLVRKDLCNILEEEYVGDKSLKKSTFDACLLGPMTAILDLDR